MRILIIGGTGTISTSIERQATALGHEVWTLNRGVRAKTNRTIVVDRGSPEFVDAIRSSGPWDAVIEMICYHPNQLDSLVEACRGVAKRLVFCSTVDTYGHPCKYPVTEDEPQTPLSDYAVNKIACEQRLLAEHATGDLDLTIIRPACTYSDNGPLVHTFGWGTEYLDRIIKGKPIVVHGDGNSIWASCHADDIAPVFINACDSPAASGRAYHATGFQWLSWNSYHRTIAAALGAPEPELVHIPADVLNKMTPKAGVTYLNFQYSSLFDNTAARRDLGFSPSITVGEATPRVVANIKAQGRLLNSDEDPHDDKIIAAWRAAESSLLESRP